MSDTGELIGRHLRSVREQQGLSQFQLAVLAQRSISKIRRMEKGDATVTLSDLKAIAAALEVSVCVICPIDNEDTPLKGESADSEGSDLSALK